MNIFSLVKKVEKQQAFKRSARLRRFGMDVLGSRREFSPFVNQLDKMVYGLTIYIDQSIYKSTSLYMNP